MTFIVVIKTPRFLRKPKEETFRGEWKTEDEVREVIAKYRPKSKIIMIAEHTI